MLNILIDQLMIIGGQNPEICENICLPLLTKSTGQLLPLFGGICRKKE